VIDRDPIELGSEIALHLGGKIAGECLQVGHLGRILRRNDEAEVMPIVVAALRESSDISPVLLGIEHVRLLAVEGDTVALQVRDMSCERCRAEGASLMPDDAGLHDDAAMRGTVVAEEGFEPPTHGL